MKMSQYVLRRVVFAVFTLFGLSVIIFVMARVLPGDPARMAAGPRAPEWVVEQIREQLNLDKPLHVQYFLWLRDVFNGDLGYSIFTKRSVTQDVIEYLPASLELIAVAAVFQILGAFALGVLAGMYAYRWVDNAIRLFAYIGISIPAFGWAVIFQLIFAWKLDLFPVQGMLSVEAPERITGFVTIDSLITGRFDAFTDFLKHAVLPAMALAIGPMAQEARLIRSGMIDNRYKDYILLMESHGVPRRKLMFKYLLKPSAIPAVTVMGMDIASLLGNAFLVEIVFNWPGFSRYAINVMLNKDLNAIVAVVMVIGFIFIVANIIVDIIAAYLDPRIRYVERGE